MPRLRASSSLTAGSAAQLRTSSAIFIEQKRGLLVAGAGGGEKSWQGG